AVNNRYEFIDDAVLSSLAMGEASSAPHPRRRQRMLGELPPLPGDLRSPLPLYLHHADCGSTMLHYAAEMGSVEVIAALYDAYLSNNDEQRHLISEENNSGYTPLDCGILGNHLSVLYELSLMGVPFHS